MKKSLLVLWFAFAGIISVAQIVSNGTGGGRKATYGIIR